jgi:hypothetical protein
MGSGLVMCGEAAVFIRRTIAHANTEWLKGRF